MKFSAQSNIAKIRRELASDLRQERYAAMRALNETAFGARKLLRTKMTEVFDRVTPYVLNSVLVRQATRDNLAAEVYIDFWGRGKGVQPEKILMAEVFGGQRRNKRAELALQRVGLMPKGWLMVPANAPEDGYGNVPGSFIVRLLSYFAAFSEQGYRANATARKKAKLANRGVTANGFSTTQGVEYFVSHGKGERIGRGSAKHGREQHLPAGIWQRTGIHGSKLTPVFLFVRGASYATRLRFFDIVQNFAAGYFPRALDAARAAARSTAR